MSTTHLFPSLLKHGTVYNDKLKRAACSDEHLAARGFPTCSLREVVEVPYAVPFEHLLNDLSAPQKKALCGNAMHIVCVTSFLLYGVAHLRFHKRPEDQKIPLQIPLSQCQASSAAALKHWTQRKSMSFLADGDGPEDEEAAPQWESSDLLDDYAMFAMLESGSRVD